LANPVAIEERLESIDARLAQLTDELEPAALAWFRRKRDREEAHAKAYVAAEGNHTQRKAAADEIACHIGVEEEAAWEGKRAVLKTLEARSMVGATLLKAQQRVGG
jgi:hypothetical protein